MKPNLALIAIAALTLTLAFIQPGVAKGGNSEKGGGKQTQSGDSHGTGHHGDIDSGRDFGQHVKEMNDNFSGDHNPGRHHNGFSELKD